MGLISRRELPLVAFAEMREAFLFCVGFGLGCVLWRTTRVLEEPLMAN